ncbi:MAG: CDP-glycerol glycerophosphotransferase family protein [Candidatus Omnitrophica bacterium]|nr:CDP-glycerol glycerophosphotransferase family protein [Candidatus Omnitrophota bacterium]
MNKLTLFIRAFQDVLTFNALPQKERTIVFYSEDNASWLHFETIIEELTHTHKKQICYLTSSPNDPIFKMNNPRIKPFFVGMGAMRTYMFSSLKAKIMILTMPDIETFHIKRSQVFDVHYVYIFHSMFSVHSYLRKGAVDHYDSVFCVGPHHNQEIRATEKVYALPEKKLINFGYIRLDTLLKESKNRREEFRKADHTKKRILVAPSFGQHSLLENHGQKIVEVLLKAGYHVTVRPHPVTQKKSPQILKALTSQFGSHPDFVMETEIRSYESLHNAHCMICDWSGVSWEYAFGLERPVLFIDVPKKVNNPDFGDIDIVPLEIPIRNDIGKVIAPDNLEVMPKVIEELYRDYDDFAHKIQKIREATIYNIGFSGKVGAEYIAGLAEDS